MSTKREAFYVEGSGVEPELVSQGINWLAETSLHQGAETAHLIVPAIDNLTDGSIAEAIGDGAAESLAKGKPVKLTEGTKLVAHSERTMLRQSLHGPVLAVYCTPEILTKIDTASRNQPMAIVSWLEEDGKTWKNKWQARPVGSKGEATPTSIGLSNPVVAEALKSLTIRVNLSTGISHPRDRNIAVHMFRILKRNGEVIDFDELPGWLIAHNWCSSHSDQIVKMGRDIYDGKRLHAGTSPWGTQQIRTWRSRAKK